MPSSQKNAKVMIACVTDEVTMVVQPVDYYRIERIHLITFVKPVKDRTDKTLYNRSKFYETVQNEVLKELNGKCEIEIHNDKPTYAFDDMMESVYTIIGDEQKKGSIVYVNLCSGSREFSAAAAIASMMHRNVNIFTMGGDANALTVTKYDSMLESITHKGRIVGRFYNYHDPFPITGFSLNTPPIKLVKALKIFDTIPMKKRTNTYVIRNLIMHGIWNPCGDEAEPDYDKRREGTSAEFETIDNHPMKNKDHIEYKNVQRKEAVQYQRNYIDKWKAMGWIEKDPDLTGTKYRVTEDGKMNIRIFCPEVFEEKDLYESPSEKA